MEPWPRVVFAGTPPFAAAALEALLDAGCPVPLVLTQPDRPAGRGLRTLPSAVRELAAARGIEVATPVSLGERRGGPEAAAALARIRALGPDLLVVAAYGLILPSSLLEAPRGVAIANGRMTAVNIHASLLPRWRGAAPVARAIEAGDECTGITLMQMDAGLDTGPMLVAREIPIAAADTAATLAGRLAELGAAMIVEALRDGAAARLFATVQPAAGVTYAHKLEKREAWLDFARPADELARRVRAFNPAPGAAASLAGAALKLWTAEAAGRSEAPPGSVVGVDADGLRIACGAGTVLRVTELQRAGGRRMPAAAFAAGATVRVGARIDPPPSA